MSSSFTPSTMTSLITDAAHLAVMHNLNIHHLATDDADLSHIPGIVVWTPV
jgi:predicted nucleic acid-binding protein